jgi:N-acetylglucosaminyldiphosphoundecaprenol N-acetyl-beta-D-mannosaminyltransferase
MGGKAPAEAPPLLNFFGIPVINTTMAEAVGWIIGQAAGGGAAHPRLRQSGLPQHRLA